jgi:hypothetical protein
MTEAPVPYDSFLLRVWSIGPDAALVRVWRATLTRVRDGATQNFSNPADLLSFLEGKQTGTWHLTDSVEPGD